MDPNHPFGRVDEAHPDIPNLQHAYRKIIRELIYLSTCSHPDITLAVQRLSQQCAQPEPRHFLAARQVIRYLKGTLSLCIHFGNPNVDLSPHAFSDSDWATSPEDCVSITGYVWYFHGGTISHASKKQTTHALSSAEAEYMALASCIQEGISVIALLRSLDQPIVLPLRVNADNTTAISLSTTANNHSCSKHIDVRYHFIHEHIAAGSFKPSWVPTRHNVADILTKPLV